MSYAYSEGSSKQLASKGDEEARTHPSRQYVETDSSEESDRSSEHVPGHRPVRVTVYGLKQESEIVRIWIDEKSTYGDIREGLAHLHGVQGITVLQAVYGRKPYWIESMSESTIEPTCVHLYAVIVTQPQRYILGVVRTALSDYPIALFDSVNSPAMAVSQKIIRVQPNLTHRIKSITGYNKKQDMSADEYNYELLREAEESNFPTVFFITVDEAPGPFMVNASEDSIPPFLQIQFVQCRDLLQRAYNLELLPLQAIHISRAIHHLVISLAKAIGGGLSEKDSSLSADLTEKDDFGDLLRVAPIIAGNLQSVLHKFEATIEALEEKPVDPNVLMADIRSILGTLCGDYPGAVVVRHSFEAFERLARMDCNEILLSVGNGDNGRPRPRSNSSTAPRENVVTSLSPPEVLVLLDSCAPAPSSHEGPKSGGIFGSILNAVQSRNKSREREAPSSAGHAKQTASSHTPQGKRGRPVYDLERQKGKLRDVDAEIAHRLEKDLRLQDSEDPYRPIRRDRPRSLESTRSRERTERRNRDQYSPQSTSSTTLPALGLSHHLPETPRDASNAIAYAYRPGTDPSVVGEQGTSYQPSWPPIPMRGTQNAYPAHDMSHSVWPDAPQSANTRASHHETPYNLSQQWNGDPQRLFNLPTSPEAGYISYHGRESMAPVQAPRPPHRVECQPLLRHDHPPPPTLNRDDHPPQDHDLYSPQSTSSTPPAHGPFAHFQEKDPEWNITYREKGGGVDDDDDSEMPEARIDFSCGTAYVSLASPGCNTLPLALGSNYTASNSDYNHPSTSAQVFEVQVDGPSRTVRLSEDLEAHFPNQPALKKLALYILDQPWCLLNDEEPPISQSEPVVLLKFFKRTPNSRFDPFFDEKLRCHLVEANGDRCRHVTTRKDRAVGHARAHFGYKPFACAGKCGKSGCLERYTCASYRNDHVGRKRNPKRPCASCQKLLTAQSLKRHMKQHHVSPSHVTAFSPQGEETEAPLSKRPKLSIFRRPFGKK